MHRSHLHVSGNYPDGQNHPDGTGTCEKSHQKNMFNVIGEVHWIVSIIIFKSLIMVRCFVMIGQVHH